MATITIPAEAIITAEQRAAHAQAAMLDAFERAIQRHIDDTAASRRYRDGFALAGYVTSTVPAFAAEAQAFVAWRDAVWLYAYGELDKVTAGERAAPEVADFVAELPAIEWPNPEGE